MSRILFVAQDITYEPQGIMSMSALLKQAGHTVALVVADREDPVAAALEFRPDILGYSMMTGMQRGYVALNDRIRAALDPIYAQEGRRAAFTAFGGPHPTFFPDIILEDGVDGVCVGEGEGAILDLADAWRDGAPIAGIANWWFKGPGGEVERNPVRPLIRELSELPLPDRALIYDAVPELAKSRIKHFMTARGCPYDCTYCFNHAFYERYKGERRGYRRTVDDVIAEVDAVRSRWPLEQVVFVDDLFIIHDRWLEEFADAWPARVGLPFFCNVRADLLVRDPRRVALLKRAGCTTASMGIEAANDHIRHTLLKRRMTREEIVEAGRMMREAGIHITATNILGLPTSTVEDDLDTMRLNAEARISYAHAFLFQPYPGTELGRFTKENGLMAGSFEDIGELAWDSSILAFPEDDKRQREHLQRLFALGVEWPWLEPAIRKAIRMPHNGAVDRGLWWLEKLYRGTMIYRRVHPIQLSFADFVSTATHFMKARS